MILTLAIDNFYCFLLWISTTFPLISTKLSLIFFIVEFFDLFSTISILSFYFEKNEGLAKKKCNGKE
jgi:hypothetical protein